MAYALVKYIREKVPKNSVLAMEITEKKIKETGAGVPAFERVLLECQKKNIKIFTLESESLRKKLVGTLRWFNLPFESGSFREKLARTLRWFKFENKDSSISPKEKSVNSHLSELAFVKINDERERVASEKIASLLKNFRREKLFVLTGAWHIFPLKKLLEEKGIKSKINMSFIPSRVDRKYLSRIMDLAIRHNKAAQESIKIIKKNPESLKEGWPIKLFHRRIREGSFMYLFSLGRLKRLLKKPFVEWRRRGTSMQSPELIRDIKKRNEAVEKRIERKLIQRRAVSSKRK
jgi:hypothetical protein